MFVDTNVLVYASVKGAPNHDVARAALLSQASAGGRLCISRQVLREYMVVISRPQTWARAMTAEHAAAAATSLARDLEVLEDNPAGWDQLMDLCRNFEFGGRQIHDANIVATMLAHGEKRLLTFNRNDFERFAGLIDIIAP